MIKQVFLDDFQLSRTVVDDQQAERAAPGEAVYPSNLSAALFELGDYASCFKAIVRATPALSKAEKQSTLLTRLSTRLAKALTYGSRDGSLPSDVYNSGSAADVIKTLSLEAEKASASEEIKWAWKEWYRVRNEKKHVEENAADARIRL